MDQKTLEKAASIAKHVADEYRKKADMMDSIGNSNGFISCVLVMGEAEDIARRILELGDKCQRDKL